MGGVANVQKICRVEKKKNRTTLTFYMNLSSISADFYLMVIHSKTRVLLKDKAAT